MASDTVTEQTPFCQILQNHASVVIDEDKSIFLEVERESLWRRALAFYKQAMGTPCKLKQRLTITFIGEEGVDAGALRGEFFGELLKELDKRLFEGSEDHRVPKKSFHGGISHAIAGMMIGHSLLQHGPGFACLAKPIYYYIASECIDTALEQGPTIADIPLDASTSNLHEFIRKVCEVYVVLLFYVTKV